MHKYTLKLDDTDENYHNFIFETDDHRDLDATGDSPLDIEVDINKGVEICLDPVTMKNWAFWKKPRGTHRRRRNTTLSIDLPFWAVDLTEVEDPKVIKFMMKRFLYKALVRPFQRAFFN